MRKIIVFSLLLAAGLGNVDAQELVVPDTNFKRALFERGVDANSNGILEVQEASKIAVLNVQGKGIHDLTGIGAFTNLHFLDCSKNQLTRLDVKQNVLLQTLTCNNNLLDSLDLRFNRALANVFAFDNRLHLLQLVPTNNTVLNYLSIGNNLLETLNLGKQLGLFSLSVPKNRLQKLDLSKNARLKYLSVYSNRLDSLRLEKNLWLEYLSCANNQLKQVEVAALSRLRYLYCQQNLLYQLEVSQNDSLERLDARGTFLPSICVSQAQLPKIPSWRADDITKWKVCDYVHIPDPAFKQVLLSLDGLDANGNGEIEYSEASTTTYLHLYLPGVRDLTGLEAFAAVKQLHLRGTQVENIRLKALRHLVDLDVSSHTLLKSLELPDADSLFQVRASDNPLLTRLQLGNSPFLKRVYASQNKSLVSLDLQKALLLEYLECEYNQLQALDVSHNPQLRAVRCGYNQLSYLSFRHNPRLTDLVAYYNRLDSLDIRSNLHLYGLDASNNRLTSLDLRNNTGLYYVNLSDNRLGQVCISQVQTYRAGGWDASPHGSFVVCTQIIQFPDSVFKAKLLSLGVDVNGDYEIDWSEAQAVKTLDLDSSGITDLTGIKGFTNLDTLRCRGNQLKGGLYLFENFYLRYLDCSHNQLDGISLSYYLEYLDCSHNRFQILELYYQELLQFVDCSHNYLYRICISEASESKTGTWIKDGNSFWAVCDPFPFRQGTDLATSPASSEVLAYFSPQPSHGLVKVHANAVVSAVTLYDLEGRPLFRAPGASIDVSELKSGVYIATIETQAGIVRKKLHVQ